MPKDYLLGPDYIQCAKRRQFQPVIDIVGASIRVFSEAKQNKFEWLGRNFFIEKCGKKTSFLTRIY